METSQSNHNKQNIFDIPSISNILFPSFLLFSMSILTYVAPLQTWKQKMKILAELEKKKEKKKILHSWKGGGIKYLVQRVVQKFRKSCRSKINKHSKKNKKTLTREKGSCHLSGIAKMHSKDMYIGYTILPPRAHLWLVALECRNFGWTLTWSMPPTNQMKYRAEALNNINKLRKKQSSNN